MPAQESYHTYGSQFTAKHPGWCPVCGRFIAPKRSAIVRVTPAVWPRVDNIDGETCVRALRCIDYERGVKPAPRQYIHAACERLLNEIDVQVKP
jgi:hypothetical protein